MTYRDDLSTYHNNVEDEPAGRRRGWWRELLSSLRQACRSFAAGSGGPWR